MNEYIIYITERALLNDGWDGKRSLADFLPS